MELNGGIDYPDVGVARIYAVLSNGQKEYMGEVRAYNFEAIWLSTNKYDEVDDAEEWWKCIEDDYRELKKKDHDEEPKGRGIPDKKEVFHFTVGKLIKVLKALPQDLPVLTSGYEGGFENIYPPDIIKVKHEPENPYYEGEFQVAENEDEETFEALVIRRVVRDE